MESERRGIVLRGIVRGGEGTYRCDHDDDEVRQPMAEDADGGGLVADTERLDLSGVRPRDGEDAERETVEV